MDEEGEGGGSWARGIFRGALRSSPEESHPRPPAWLGIAGKARSVRLPKRLVQFMTPDCWEELSGVGTSRDDFLCYRVCPGKRAAAMSLRKRLLVP